MLLILLAWIYCFLLASAIGAGLLKALSKVIGAPLNATYGVFYQFWFGYVILLGLLQVLSLFLPLNFTVFLIVSIIAVLLALFNIRNIWEGRLSLYRWLTSLRGFTSFIAISILLVLIAYSANREVLHGDTFLYHYNAVRWVREYPAVPGLANLHSRLGFNSSFFLFAAFTEVGVYEHNSAHIALSFLIAVCTAHWFCVITNPKELAAKRIFCMMTALYLLIRVVTQIEISSLATDYPMAIMTMIFALVLIDKVRNKLVLLLPLSALVFTFKLSGLISVGIGLLVLFAHVSTLTYNSDRRRELKTILVSFGLLSFIVCGFVIRNIIVSGWLLFPLPVGNLHLPWSVPKPYVVDAMAWVESYGKIPGGASPESIAGKSIFYWFQPWVNYFKRFMEFDMLVASFFILLWAMVQIKSFGKFMYGHLNELLLIVFALLSILFWFFSAPDIRFGSVSFFILLAGAIIILYQTSKYKFLVKHLVTMLFIFQMVYRAPSYVYDRTPNLFTFPYTKQRELVRVLASPADEKPALYIYMPATGDACGDSPLPCTPYANGMVHEHRPLRQRKPGDLSKGFLPTAP